MRLWRIRKSRSSRRQTLAILSAHRTEHGAQWARRRFGRWLRRVGFPTIGAIALVLHAPMLFFVGDKSKPWLDGAWQISGVLLGLVIATIIFLLQAATTQSLRTEASFLAVLRHTFVLWPISFAMVFITAVATVRRFTGTDAASSIVETYALLLFVIQVLLFALAIQRAIGVVSPQGVARVVSQAFSDGVHRAVEQNFHANVAYQLLDAACTQHGVRHGSFLASGWPISPKREGWVRDVDLSLPARLNAFGVAQHMTLTSDTGHYSSPANPVARSSQPLRPWLIREVSVGIVISRRPPPQPPIRVFDDAVDLARRALLDGSDVSRDLAVDLISDCVTAFHDVYALYGQTY